MSEILLQLNKSQNMNRCSCQSVAIMAMEEITMLVIEDPYLRRKLRESSEFSRLRKIEQCDGKESRIREWASRTIAAIENTRTYDLWAKVITDPNTPITPHEIEHLLDRSASNPNGKLLELSGSLE